MNFRALARALVAACALSVVVGVSAASAAQFKAESYPAYIGGINSKKVVLTTEAGSMTCSINTMELGSPALMTGPTGKIAVQMTLNTLCSPNFHPNGCHFTSTLGEKISGSIYSGTFGIEYASGTSCYEAESTPHYVVVEYPSCTATIKAQSGLNSMELETRNTGAARYVMGRLNVTGLSYELSGAGASCKKGVHSDGTLTGWFSYEAWDNESGKKVGLFIE